MQRINSYELFRVYAISSRISSDLPRPPACDPQWFCRASCVLIERGRTTGTRRQESRTVERSDVPMLSLSLTVSQRHRKDGRIHVQQRASNCCSCSGDEWTGGAGVLPSRVHYFANTRNAARTSDIFRVAKCWRVVPSSPASPSARFALIISGTHGSLTIGIVDAAKRNAEQPEALIVPKAGPEPGPLNLKLG